MASVSIQPSLQGLLVHPRLTGIPLAMTMESVNLTKLVFTLPILGPTKEKGLSRELDNPASSRLKLQKQMKSLIRIKPKA